MNTRLLGLVVIVALAGAGCQRGSTSGVDTLESATLAGDELISTPYGTIALQQNYITDESSQRLFDAMDLERAAQAYIWSTPPVSFYTWKIEQDKNYGTGELGTWAVLESLKEKRGIVTANLTTPYIFQFYDLRNGALVIDYPAGPTAGAVLDFWQRPIFDMGLTGPDQGKGGRYVLVGPGDDVGRYREADAYVYQSATNNIGLGLRLLDPSPEYAETVKSSLRMGIYGHAPVTTRFNEGLDVEWSATAYRGLEYWRVLSRFINEEPIREQDKAWTAMLAPLGIAKGKEFQPDERQRRILVAGAALGELMLRNLQINPRMEEPYWPGTHWYRSVGFTIPQITDDRVELDERGIWFYEAVTTSKGMVNPSVGAGQIYMTTKHDSDGNLLRADRTYRLRVPANVPVEQFWALTLYSENTRRPYDNGGTELRSANLDSRMEDLQHNADGSVDLYVGVEAPAGMKSNFLKTVDKDGWFVYFRLYAPKQAFFDKTFSLPDFELVR